jgi:hypothetical protein
MKLFNVVSLISLVLTLTVATAIFIGLTITGFYPGMIVLLLLTLIPITSKIYTAKISGNSENFKRNYYLIFTIANLITILLVMWMTFVIMVDRVFGKLI